MQGFFEARPISNVGFSDRRCRLCGRFGFGKPVALHFRVQQLPMDVQAACGFGAIAAARRQSLADHRRFKLGDRGRQIASSSSSRVGGLLGPTVQYRGPSPRSYRRAPVRRRAQSRCAAHARCRARNAAEARLRGCRTQALRRALPSLAPQKVLRKRQDIFACARATAAAQLERH